MSDVIGNAILILRCLRDLDAVGSAAVTRRDLMELTGLSEDSFSQADGFLRARNYVGATLDGSDGRRWMTSDGVEFLEEHLSKRIKLSLTGERIARYLFDKREKDYRATGESIQEALGLTKEEYEEAACELIDEGLAEEGTKLVRARFFDIRLSSEGRRAVRRSFTYEEESALPQNIGAIIHGPVLNSNVQAVAQAHQSRIQQEIEDGNIEALRDEIARLSEIIVESVKDELDTDQLAVYAEAAKELEEEATKDEPNPSMFHKCLRVLSFAGDLDGTIELAGKALALGNRVLPLISLLRHAVEALLQRLRR